MGWQSDWLYDLIFLEVEKVWRRALAYGSMGHGPPPAALLVSEAREGDWQTASCRSEAVRHWIYRGREPEPLLLAGAEPDPGQRRGMFYERGLVAFCVAADRKQVLFTFVLGPLFGEGMVFDVVGQGAQGRLSRSAGPSWIS
jgi:hypothetical protein